MKSLKSGAPYLALFTSVGTLICCALPALFVALGMGGVLVSVISAVPQLVWFSEHKALVFSVAGVMLAAAAVSRRMSANLACPVDQAEAAACGNAKKVSCVMFWLSVLTYLCGAFFAFAAPLFL